MDGDKVLLYLQEKNCLESQKLISKKYQDNWDTLYMYSSEIS